MTAAIPAVSDKQIPADTMPDSYRTLTELVCHHVHVKRGESEVAVEVLHAVAQEAVDAVAGEELLARADLVGEYQQWMEEW